MARRKPSEDEKRRIWSAISNAAKAYYNRTGERGLGVLIASDAGVKPQSVSEWKNLATAPSDAALQQLADTYGVPVETLSGQALQDSDRLPASEVLAMAAELTGTVVREALSGGSVEQFLSVMAKAHELILSGVGEDEAYGKLFRHALAIRDTPHLMTQD